MIPPSDPPIAWVKREGPMRAMSTPKRVKFMVKFTQKRANSVIGSGNERQKKRKAEAPPSTPGPAPMEVEPPVGPLPSVPSSAVVPPVVDSMPVPAASPQCQPRQKLDLLNGQFLRVLLRFLLMMPPEMGWRIWPLSHPVTLWRLVC